MSSQHAARNNGANPGAKKRKCTPEELAARSRANGARSRGPTSAAGLEKCRTARQTHGLTNRIIRPLPTEDPQALAAKVQWWYDYYKPESPAAHLMTTMCAHSDVMIHRCYTFLAGHLGGQAGAVARDWEANRQRAVARAVETLATQPREGLAELRSFSHGCRWLLDRWSHYQSGLATYGYWPPKVWPEVLRVMFGADHHLDRIRDASPRGYLAVLYNLRCLPASELGEDQIIGLCAPRRRPRALQAKDLPAAIPAAAECRAWLQEVVAERIEKLQRLEASLRLGKERAALDGLIEKAALPEDGEASRQYLRYHGESCSKFLRTFDKLPRELQRAASGFYDFDEPAPADGTDEPQTLSPRERVPEGRVRAGAQPNPDASDGAEVQARATAPQNPDASEGAGGPAPDSANSPGGSGDTKPATVAAEPPGDGSPTPHVPDASGSALPAVAELPVEAATACPKQAAFPDGPSRALPAAAELSPGKAPAEAKRAAFPDGPGRASPAVSGIPPVAGDPSASVPAPRAGPEDPSQPGDRAPPAPRRDSARSRDGSPHAVP
jgi:hypothetical protein